jgi:F-type H+-transporting ATPase subunit b
MHRRLPSRPAASTAMLTTQLPFADIIQNFEDIGAQTGFTLPQFIAQCIAVIVLFTLLQQLAWKPVRTILEQRRKTIEEGMANAEKIKQELADAEATRLSIIQQANEKANAIIAEAEKSAVIVTEQRAREATRQADDIIKNAHEASVLDRNRLMAELKRHIGELVVQTTEKVAGKVLTAQDQARLNEETIRQLTASNN